MNNTFCRKAAVGAALVVFILAALAPLAPAAVAATPGRPVCTQLLKACIAHNDRRRAAFGGLKNGEQRASFSPQDLDDERCRDAYRDALKTGKWPAYKVHPAIGCSPN